MLGGAISASTVSTLGAGINRPGLFPGNQGRSSGTTAVEEQPGIAESGQTFSSATTVSLSTAATTFLQASGIERAPADRQSAGNAAGQDRTGDEADNTAPEARSERQSADAREALDTVRGSAEEGPNGLTDAERQQVQSLRQTDAEIRRHEQAHAMVGGPYAGAPRYQYTKGPDGKQYAISGQVSIDASSIPGDPQATIQKLRIVRRAALAPSDPSGQDQQVAATAQRGIIEARRELAEETAEESAENAAESGREVIGENVGPIRDEALASPVIDAALASSLAAPGGVRAVNASLAFARASSLTLQRPPGQSLSV
ncbi:MAG: putative metalloprotease CJM1_0395 family protein [Alphaproteobacteria bacterium]